MKLYWRVKIDGKWTYVAAIIEDHLYDKVGGVVHSKDQKEYWYIPKPKLKKELKE